MDEQTTVSKQIIDRRHIVTGGIAGVIALFLGLALGRSTTTVTGTTSDRDADLVQITSTALDRGDDYWSHRLEPSIWRMPHVVLIDHDRGENSPCGRASAASGPFYCPSNERIYIDLQFLRAIPGDLARAYVTAHELGHHVQKLREEDGHRSSVSIELGADCYAGMWMRSENAQGHITSDDVKSALAEASAVGDDRICPSCSSEQWTHGSAAQRAAALSEGLSGGSCDQWRYVQ